MVTVSLKNKNNSKLGPLKNLIVDIYKNTHFSHLIIKTLDPQSSVSGFKIKIPLYIEIFFTDSEIILKSHKKTSNLGLLKSKIEQGLIGICNPLLNTVSLNLTGVGYWVKKEESKLLINVGQTTPFKIDIPSHIHVDIISQDGFYLIKCHSFNKEQLNKWVSDIENIKKASKDKYTHKGFKKLNK